MELENQCSKYIIALSATNEYFFEDESKRVFLKAPTESGKYTFVLQFDEEKIYGKIKTEIKKNRDKPVSYTHLQVRQRTSALLCGFQLYYLQSTSV